MSSEMSVFQCLICGSFLDNLLKVEKHIEKHKDGDNDFNNANQANVNGGETSTSSSTEPQVRRRGMLPIKKVTFSHLTVDLYRCEIGALYNDDDDAGPPELDYYGPPRDVVVPNKVSTPSPSKVTPESGRLHRRSRLKADAKLREVTAILRIPDQVDFQQNEETDAEMDFIRNLEVDDDDNDNDNDDEPYNDGDYVPSKKSTKSKSKTQYKKRIHKAAAVLTQRGVGRPRKNFGGGGGRQSSKKSSNATTTSIEKVSNEKRCIYCDQSFATQYELSHHVLESHPEEYNSLSCPVPTCARKFQCRSSLATHINVHNNAERHEILVRNDPSSSAAEFLRAQNSGGSLKRIERLLATSSFRCKFCVQKCETQDELKQHLRQEHADVTILKCPECTTTFDNDCNDVIMTLIVHVRMSHPERLDPFNEMEKEREAKKKFKCSKCSNRFRTSNGLKKHMNTHKPKIESEDQSTLNEQLKLDADSSSSALGPEPFHCPVCKKGFRYKDNLRRHFTLHLENNPFVCKFPGCRAKFNSDYNLRRHGAIHLGVKRSRLNCPICPSTAWTKDKLVKHLKDCHKPSDMKDGVVDPAVLAKYRAAVRYTYRPNRRKYETYQTLQTKSSSPPTPKIVKMEPSAENINEIHLVDKIVIQDDGNVVHVKGETLSPQKSQPQLKSPPPPSSKASASSSKCKIFIPKSVKLGGSTEPVTSIIARDPVFQKLADKDATVREMLTSKVYGGSAKIFSCGICPQTFTRAWTLQLHLQTIHKSSILEQEQKQKEINRKQNLQKQKGGANVTLMCGRCAYTAKNAADLESHMKTAPFHGSHGPTCEKCQETFKNQSQLDSHLDAVHNVQTRPFVCQFCRKSFATEIFLKNHEARIHSSRKVASTSINSKKETSECPICHKMLSHMSLNEHIKRHDTEALSKVKDTNFQCKLCLDSFANAQSLQRHVDCVHLGKPLNKGQNTKRKKLIASAPATTSSLERDPLEISGSRSNNEPVRRGPKPKHKPENEWYMSLVEQALPVDGTFSFSATAANNRDAINDSNEPRQGAFAEGDSSQETDQSQEMNVDVDDGDGGEMSILGF